MDEKTKEELGIIEYKTGVGLNPEEYERSKSAAKKKQKWQQDMVCLSCGKQGHYNKLNFMCPLNNKNQANTVKYGAQEELQRKEDNEGTGNLPPLTDTVGMTADGNFMPAAGSGKTIFTGTGAGMASLDPVVHTGT